MIKLNCIKGMLYLAGGFALSAGLSSCLMHDDLEDCAVAPAVSTSVDFVYDYNTKAADLFNEDAGAVTLYVYDGEGHLVKEQTRTQLPGSDNGRMELELVPGDYNVYALAHAHDGGFDGALGLPGAKFRLADLSSVHPENDVVVAIDHNNGLVEHGNVMLDVVWATLAPQKLSVPEVGEPEEGDVQMPDIEVHATVPLMRMTKHLTVTLWQSDFPSAIDPAFYDVTLEFPKGNGHFNLVGTLLGSQPITYSPFATRTVTKTISGTPTKCLELEFGLSRLMVGDGARLVVKNRLTGQQSVISDLCKNLAVGRGAFDTFNWSEQEYLDREHEYSLDVCYDGIIPKWIQINVEILGWAKRIIPTDL